MSWATCGTGLREARSSECQHRFAVTQIHGRNSPRNEKEPPAPCDRRRSESPGATLRCRACVSRAKPERIRTLERLIQPRRGTPFADPLDSLEHRRNRAKVRKAKPRSVAKMTHVLGFTPRSPCSSRGRAAESQRIAQLPDLNVEARKFSREGRPVTFVETLVRAAASGKSKSASRMVKQ